MLLVLLSMVLAPPLFLVLLVAPPLLLFTPLLVAPLLVAPLLVAPLLLLALLLLALLLRALCLLLLAPLLVAPLLLLALLLLAPLLRVPWWLRRRTRPLLLRAPWWLRRRACPRPLLRRGRTSRRLSPLFDAVLLQSAQSFRLRFHAAHPGGGVNDHLRLQLTCFEPVPYFRWDRTTDAWAW